MKVNKNNEVRIVGFVTNNKVGKCGPVPANYLSNEVNLPKELIDDMKLNGWSDEDGNLWWSKDFEPEPMHGSDGNVYLCLSDEDMKNPKRYLERMGKAIKMLNLDS